MQDRSLIIIGSGISGLITAFYATKAGFQVNIISRSADPFSITDENTDYYSSTYNGENSRQISLLENKLTLAENIIAQKLWREIFSEKPELFKDTLWKDDGILHLFSSNMEFNHYLKFLTENNLKFEIPSSHQLLKMFPLSENEALTNVVISPGISFRHKTFCKNMSAYLSDAGVKFSYSTEISELLWESSASTKEKTLLGLQSKNGERLSAQNYVFHLGAYDQNNLFRGTRIENKVIPAFGAWLHFPLLDNEIFALPLKIHHTKIDLTINQFESRLYIGGGLEFSSDDTLTTLQNACLHLFGERFKQAKNKGEVSLNQKKCARSYTADGKEVFEIFSSSDGDNKGQAIVEGGGNTGTTAKAPLLANRIINHLKLSR
jgi:glycine/D-amino acid oxidase-like deaminating enzyme